MKADVGLIVGILLSVLGPSSKPIFFPLHLDRLNIGTSHSSGRDKKVILTVVYVDLHSGRSDKED